MRDPKTRAQWQRAVDGAAGLRVLADAKMYGLLEGGPDIDVDRCDEILERGAARGIHPSKPVKVLAAEYVDAYNRHATRGN